MIFWCSFRNRYWKKPRRVVTDIFKCIQDLGMLNCIMKWSKWMKENLNKSLQNVTYPAFYPKNNSNVSANVLKVTCGSYSFTILSSFHALPHLCILQSYLFLHERLFVISSVCVRKLHCFLRKTNVWCNNEFINVCKSR